MIERTKRRSDEVPASIERLAAAAVASGVPLLSHDDTSPERRRWFRALGCRLAEFPTTVETAEDAASHGDDVVLGAPNVVRGGSHTGWIDATEMIARGLCSVLASDYYYPAPLLAAFTLVKRDVLPFAQAWALVSQTPANAVELNDRGQIAPGRRADLIIVDASAVGQPRVESVNELQEPGQAQSGDAADAAQREPFEQQPFDERAGIFACGSRASCALCHYIRMSR